MDNYLRTEEKELKIRVLKESELSKAVQMFVDIFKEDVFYSTIFREESQYLHMLYLYFEVMAKTALRSHNAFIAGDFLGGSLFFPPSISHVSIYDQIFLAKKAVGAYSLRKFVSSLIELKALERETPHILHYYLFLVGHLQDTGFQHRGIGKALVMPTLKECDRIQVPCYAEFTSEKSAAWGEKLGFKILKEVKLSFHPDVLIRLAIRDPFPE